MKLLLPATIATTIVTLFARLSNAAAVFSSNVAASSEEDDEMFNDLQPQGNQQLNRLAVDAASVLKRLEVIIEQLGLPRNLAKRRSRNKNNKKNKNKNKKPTSAPTMAIEGITIKQMHTGTFEVKTNDVVTITLKGNSNQYAPTSIKITSKQIEIFYANHPHPDKVKKEHPLSQYGLDKQKPLIFKLWVGGGSFDLTSPKENNQQQIIGSVPCNDIGKCTAVISGVSATTALSAGRRALEAIGTVKDGMLIEQITDAKVLDQFKNAPSWVLAPNKIENENSKKLRGGRP